MDLPERPTGTVDGSLAERVDSLATWVNEIEARLRAAEVATGDEKTAKELRKALEALSKHDPKLEKRVTDRVEVISERFETLSSTVATTAAALAAREGEIAGLRRELEDAERRIGELVGKAGHGADAGEIARLRSIVDALSAQRPVRASDSRVDELGATVRQLAERVDSLTATVSANAAALGRRDVELGALRERIDGGAARLESVAAELRRHERDDSLVERLDALQVALVEANGAIADSEQVAAQLRGRIDEAYAHVGDVVSELQRSVGELAAQVAELRTVPQAATAAVEERTAALDGRIDTVAERLDLVAASVDAGLGAIAERDGRLAGLYRDVEEERARVDALVTGLADELHALPDPAAGQAEAERRLEILRDGVARLTSRLQELEKTASTRGEEQAARATELQEGLAALSARLDGAERERAAGADERRQADESWLQERDWVRRQLERLAQAHEEASRAAHDAGPRLEELRARLDELEAERGSVGMRLDALAAAVTEIVSAGGTVPAEELAEVASRLEELESRSSAVATELARATAAWTSELSSLGERVDAVDVSSDTEATARIELTERLMGGLAARLEAIEQTPAPALDETLAARVDELAGKLARMESAVQSAAAAAAVAAARGPDEDVSDVRAAVVDLGDRVTAATEELASLADAPAVAARVDELVERLESLERASAEALPELPELDVEVDGPGAGEGRFRLELRALELRMEHAESAARENREAVLTQLERLASRVEWRLQRLEEAAQAEADGEPDETGAEIVPIRGGADTT